MKYKNFLIFFLFFISVVIAGCGTPQVVKDLSTEQLRVQADLSVQLESYFKIMEQFVLTQVTASEKRLEKLHKKNLSLHREKAQLMLAQKSSNALAELVESTKNESKILGQLKEKLASRMKSVKEKNKEFLNAYRGLLEAQQKLDTYLQLEKADERIYNQTLGKLGLSSSKFSSASKALNDALGSLSNLMK
jgi:homoserine dehydrogenase